MAKKSIPYNHTAMSPMPLGHIRPCPIFTDPQGCYTGKPIEQYETPVQIDKL